MEHYSAYLAEIPTNAAHSAPFLGLYQASENPFLYSKLGLCSFHPTTQEFEDVRHMGASDGTRIKTTELSGAIEGLDVDVPINNVGLSYPCAARYFHEVDEKLLADLIKVTVEGTSKVAHAVLQRKRGAIVNIGSGSAIACLLILFMLFIYAATKGCIDQLSRCLYVEYKQNGIDVQVQLYVATKMASIRESSFLVPSSDGYIPGAVDWLRGLMHAILAALSRMGLGIHTA